MLKKGGKVPSSCRGMQGQVYVQSEGQGQVEGEGVRVKHKVQDQS